MVFVIHWHELAMDLHVFPIPIPPPTSLSTQSLWVFPVHQVWALVSCIQPGLVICFIPDNIHVSMLFSWNIPPSSSPAESKSLFCTSVSLFPFCIWGYRYHLSKFHVYVLGCCHGLYLSALNSYSLCHYTFPWLPTSNLAQRHSALIVSLGLLFPYEGSLVM